jgi:ankyrin repeat protein
MRKRSIGTVIISIVCLFELLIAAELRAGDIHSAVAAGDLNKVKSLLEADSTLLESKDGDGNTPLNVACGAFQVTAAHFLIDMGANVNARNNYGLTTLHRAIGGKGRDIDLIRKLISKGADVNARLDRGITALHFAAMTDNLNVVQLLIDQRADLNACDNICYGTVLHTAINISPNEDIAKLLVESGTKINQKYSFENTELHLAAMKGYDDLVLLLIKHGADIQAMNGYNHTALYYAAKHGYSKTADVLIAAGARKSDITETNYGKAAQLTAKLKDGEAYFWYLGGFYGGGYAVKTKNNLLIFDKTVINKSTEASLANGNLNPKELKGQKITVLVTKATGLNYEKQVLELAKNMDDVDWVFDAKPVVKDTVNTAIQLYHLAAPNESININGIKVHTIPAAGRGNGGATGVGYIVEVDGIKIFHSGFHVSGYEPTQIENYHRKIDSLKSFGPIDIAILTVSGHLTVNYEPYLILIDRLSPKAVFLMGGDAATEEYPKCVSALQVRDVPVKYPESGRALGERFHYIRK